MKKFEGILFCTDLDGTLLKKDKTVSDNTVKAIEYFKEEGGLFTFVTGRMPCYSQESWETARPNCPFGCINGGGIYDHINQKYLWSTALPNSVKELAKYIESKTDDVGYQVSTLDKVYFCRENSATDRFIKITHVPRLIRSIDDIDEPIAKIIFCDEREENISLVRDLISRHPLSGEFDYIRSDKSLYEILPKCVTKATALVKLAELLNIDMNKTIAIGDYHNDIAMLRAARLGIAVSNACPEAKAAADYITVSNNEDAVARIIYELDCGKLKL